MNISINCNISLSKKLRALMGKEGSINLIVSELKDGKGIGVLSITGDNIDFEKETIKGETSIQLEPIGEIKMEVGGEDQACTNIFSSVPQKGQMEKIVSKIAVVNAPEKSEISTSIKTREQVNTEASIAKHAPTPECKKWISDMEQLMKVVNSTKIKHSDIDVDSARTDRERAVLMEMKEKEEAIDTQAWVVNDKYGNLSVNDLGIALPLNIPYDLGSVSARRIAASRDLKMLVRDGYIRFISPEEKTHFIQKALSMDGIGSLPVFDNHEDAMEAIGSGSISSGGSKNPVIGEDAIEITETDINNPTEEDDILNLTQNMPKVKQPRVIEETPAETPSELKHTVHGVSPTPTLKASPRPAFRRTF